MATLKLSKGKLLVAEPSILGDREFNRSVVYLTEYSKEGSIGFILNKPSDFVLNDLIPEIECKFTIFNGGPVEPENLYFIHSVPHLIPDSIKIDKNIFWGGNFNVLTDLLNENKIEETEIRFFLGYSGWSVDQLESEIDEASWLILSNKYPNIFNVDSSSFWKNQLMSIGGEYQIWANAPVDPELN